MCQNCTENCEWKIKSKKWEGCFKKLSENIHREYSVVEISQFLGISEEQVLKLEQSALKKLKKSNIL
jgi:hypothetical protein